MSKDNKCEPNSRHQLTINCHALGYGYDTTEIECVSNDIELKVMYVIEKCGGLN